MKRETFKEKQARILTAMAAKEITDATEDTLRFLKQVNSINPDPGLETKRQLFAFKGKFHLVESGQYRTIDDTEVKKLLNDHSDTKIYYLCTNESMCPLPPAFIRKEGTTGVQLKDDQAVIDYIKRITGIEIKLNNL